MQRHTNSRRRCKAGIDRGNRHRCLNSYTVTRTSAVAAPISHTPSQVLYPRNQHTNQDQHTNQGQHTNEGQHTNQGQDTNYVCPTPHGPNKRCRSAYQTNHEPGAASQGPAHEPGQTDTDSRTPPERLQASTTEAGTRPSGPRTWRSAQSGSPRTQPPAPDVKGGWPTAPRWDGHTLASRCPPVQLCSCAAEERRCSECYQVTWM